MHRYLEAQVLKDLEKKMVFLGGPRQVGKTTLVKLLPGGNRARLPPSPFRRWKRLSMTAELTVARKRRQWQYAGP